MKPFCTIKFPSGHVYEFSVAAIIEDRAKHWANLDPSRTLDEHRAAAASSLISDFALVDYIKENMVWAEIQPYARLIRYEPPSFKGSSWDDAELQPVEQPSVSTDVESMAEACVLAPIELAIGQAARSQGGAVVLAFAQPADQQITSAIVAIAGPQDLVHGYIGVVEQFNNFISSGEGVGKTAPH